MKELGLTNVCTSYIMKLPKTLTSGFEFSHFPRRLVYLATVQTTGVIRRNAIFLKDICVNVKSCRWIQIYTCKRIQLLQKGHYGKKYSNNIVKRNLETLICNKTMVTNSFFVMISETPNRADANLPNLIRNIQG